MTESKKAKFKRLAELRGERILKDLQLLSNLSNRNNYEYSEGDVKLIFSTIEEELRLSKMRFQQKKKRGINL